MYRPGAGYPEKTSEEYIELYNPDTTPVDLSGWAFTAGVSYTFPADTTIAAGGYVVVAADPAAVADAHDTGGVLGPWDPSTSLSNKGEKIELSKPGLTPGTWQVVNKVTYSSEGDWAPRTFVSTAVGFDWVTPATSTTLTFTASTTDTLTTPLAHGFVVGERVVFSTTNTLPAPLTAGTTYFVKSTASPTTLTVSTERDGATVDLTTTGTGTHTIYAGGRSIELQNPALDNGQGQNWTASTSPTGGTPNAPNSVATTDLAPIITKVKHSPAVPKSNQQVTVSCQLADETAATGLTATLHWRVATVTNPPAFQTAPMTGDDTGEFSAVLDPQANLSVVEFYVSASDGTNTRTWPATTNQGQTANCQYQVDNEVSNGGDSYYRLVLTPEQNAAFNATDINSDRRFNATLVVTRGQQTEIRYRCGMRTRGNSSRSYALARPLRVTLPEDDPLDGVTGYDINIKASYLQYIGNRLLQNAGLIAPDTTPIEFRRNGVEFTTSSGTTPDFGKWVLIQAYDGEFIDTHYPFANNGQLYKKIDNGGTDNRYWRSTGWTVPANPDVALDFWTKENNGSVNDWTDLTTFFQTWQAAAGPHFPGAPAGNVSESTATSGRLSGVGKWDGTAFTAEELASVGTVSDLAQWARFLAAETILQDLETKVSNGVDDDYSVFFVPGPGGTRRLQFLPHDLDTIFGLGDTSASYNTHGLFDATAEDLVFRTLLPLLGNSLTTGNPEFQTAYFTAIRELYGTVFNADTTGNPNPPFYAFIDNHLTGWVPAATIAQIKTFATQRQAFLLGRIAAGTTPIVPPAPTSSSILVSPPAGPLMLFEILASNTTAYQNGATFPDIIEFFNADSAPRDLSGLTLSDDPATPGRFAFPAGSSIPAGGYLVVFADSDFTAPGLHTGFGLNQNGDQLRLYDSPAHGGAVLDSITFGPQAANYSIGRTGLNHETWALCVPTPGANNTVAPSLGSPGGVVINEWLSNPGFRFNDDFLELFNPSAGPVALSGMSLTDDFINYPTRYVIPPLSYISPNGYLAFYALGKDATPGNATELPFKIANASGWLALIGANGTIADRVDIVAQPEDGSTSRTSNGGPITGLSYLAQGSITAGTRIPTPGASNTAPPANMLAVLNFLRITEISYFPTGNTDHEFLEFANAGSVVLDLTGVRISNGIDFVFPPCSLAPGGRLLVVKSASLMRSLYGNGLNIVGEFSGKLDNSGEKLVVQLPAPYDAAILSFKYEADWFPTASGGGYTLELGTVDSAQRDDDKISNWRLSTAPGGSPVTVGVPVITSSLTEFTSLTVPYTYQITATNQPFSFSLTNVPPGLSFNAATGLLSGTPTASGTYSISLTATNGVGSSGKTMTLQIIDTPPPSVTSPATASTIVGASFSYQIVATNDPTTFTATGLPANLQYDYHTGIISGTVTAPGVYNILISAHNEGGTSTQPLVLTAAASGPVATFAWDPIPGSQTLNVPFPATLRALDAQGRAVTTLNGNVTVAGQGSGVAQALVLITECGTGDTDYFEIQNVGNTTANTAGWFLVPNRGNNNGGVNKTHPAWMLPDTMAAGQVIAVFDNETDKYPESISWGSRDDAILDGWCMICDPSGSVQDFVAWGYTRTELDTIDFDITAGATPYTHIIVPQAQWQSDGIALPGTTTSQKSRVVRVRNGTTDTNRSTGWGNRNETGGNTPRANPGATNAASGTGGNAQPALTVPFFPALPTVPVTPGTGTFVNGIWHGNITVTQAATGMKLLGSDAASHTGASNTFNVTAPAAPVINSPTSASAVVNQPFRFQLTAAGPVTTWGATGLPAGLQLDPATGEISGTPTDVTTANPNLSATNGSGTGNATLSIVVAADTDADGLPDIWETTYGLNPAVGGDANGDLDGDGISNLQEFLAGTLPNDRNSRFVISSYAISGNNVVLQWNAVSTRRYRVWTTATLAGTWTSLTVTPLTGTNGTMSYTDIDGALSTPRFYRIEALP